MRLKTQGEQSNTGTREGEPRNTKHGTFKIKQELINCPVYYTLSLLNPPDDPVSILFKTTGSACSVDTSSIEYVQDKEETVSLDSRRLHVSCQISENTLV